MTFVTAIEEPEDDEELVTTTERRLVTSTTAIPWSRNRRTQPTRRSSYTNYPVYQVVENRDEGKLYKLLFSVPGFDLVINTLF